MKMNRPYKCTHDWYNSDTMRTFNGDITLNLFDISTWMECDNEFKNFNDKIQRTEVITEQNNSFYIRTPYKEFDSIMHNVLNDYKLIDTRSLTKPEFNMNFNSMN